MDLLQFDIEQHNGTPSYQNAKFFSKSGHGQLMVAYESTTTMPTTTMIPMFVPPFMRPAHNSSFTTKYRNKHFNIYFFNPKTTRLTIYGRHKFASLWIVWQTILGAVSNCFRHICYQGKQTFYATSRNLFFLLHILGHISVVIIVILNHWFEWSNTIFEPCMVFAFLQQIQNVFYSFVSLLQTKIVLLAISYFLQLIFCLSFFFLCFDFLRCFYFCFLGVSYVS